MSIILKIKMICPDITRLLIGWLKGNSDIQKVCNIHITCEFLKKGICNPQEIDDLADALLKAITASSQINQSFVTFAKDLLYRLIGEMKLFTIYSMPNLISRIRSLSSS